MRLSLLAFALSSGLAWLMPNHYLPWVSAWGEAIAMSGLLTFAGYLIFISPRRELPTGFAILALLASLSVVIQCCFGRIPFKGDAVVVLLYIAVWTLAVWCGSVLAKHEIRERALSYLASSWVLAAIISVGIALVQWTGVLDFGIYVVDLPPGERPFSNVAQPNHFNTICFIGLCGLMSLYEKRWFGRWGLHLAADFLLFGMALAQSRTGWVQFGLFIVLVVVLRMRIPLRIRNSDLLTFGAAFSFFWVLRPVLCEILLLPSGRTLASGIQPDARVPYWTSMIDAVGREFWTGYGWLQTGSAQQRVAQDHPNNVGLFDYSHNLFLDFLLWVGFPLGLCMALIVSVWFVSRIRACICPNQVWLMAMLSGVLAHGLLEYPLSYAYFLIPFGLGMGLVHQLGGAGHIVRIPRWILVTLVVVTGLVSILVAVDYFGVEQRFRDMRFELARIGAPPVTKNSDEAIVLDQLEALMWFYRAEAKLGQSKEDWELMRKVAQRFGYPPILLRFALASGLQGYQDEAAMALERICNIHVVRRCQEAQSTWRDLQERYPELLTIEIPKRRGS